MMARHVHFGEALRGAANGPVRVLLFELARHCPGASLHIDSVPSLLSSLPTLPVFDDDAPVVVLLDMHCVYSCMPQPATAALDSLLRYIADDYPFKPLSRLLAAARLHPYRFVHDLESLHVLKLLWRDSRPRRLSVANLVTGEIRHGEFDVHPESIPPRVTRAGPPRRPLAPAVGDHTLRRVVVDDTLRLPSPPALESISSEFAGCMKRVRHVSNSASMPMAVAEVVRQNAATQLCYGKAFSPSEALFVAQCEAAERFQVSFQNPDDDLVLGSYRELQPLAIDPRRLFFNTDPTPVGVRAYDDDLCMHWTWGFNLTAQAPVLVPAQEMWFNTRRLRGEHIVINRTTNGCAVGSTPEEATLFALFEAIERDAFLVMWYLRRPCALIELDSIAYEPFQLLRRRWELAFSDYRLRIFDVTCDTGIPAVAAFALRERGRGPQVFCAAAARLSAERACFTALKDLTGFRTTLSNQRPDDSGPRVTSDSVIDGPQHHFNVYSQDGSLARLAFLNFGGEPRTDAREINERAIVASAVRYDLADIIGRCVDHLRTIDVEVTVKDITHESVRRAGLRCVRVLAPGLFPMWYGSPPRFAVTPRLQRLALSLLGPVRGASVEYNVGVHPFT